MHPGLEYGGVCKNIAGEFQGVHKILQKKLFCIVEYLAKYCINVGLKKLLAAECLVVPTSMY